MIFLYVIFIQILYWLMSVLICLFRFGSWIYYFPSEERRGRSKKEFRLAKNMHVIKNQVLHVRTSDRRTNVQDVPERLLKCRKKSNSWIYFRNKPRPTFTTRKMIFFSRFSRKSETEKQTTFLRWNAKKYDFSTVGDVKAPGFSWYFHESGS